MRAREPDQSGHAIARDGVHLWYEVHGAGPQTVFLLPTWPALDARVWKLQVPYLARHFRVVVADPRGNGASDRPVGPTAYTPTVMVEDAVAVLDASGTRSAVCVGLSMGGKILLQLAATHPERVDGAVFLAPAVRIEEPEQEPEQEPERRPSHFDQPYGGQGGWARYNAEHWRDDLAGFARWFFGEAFSEPHSTKQLDDAVAWTLQAGAETLVDIERAPYLDRDGSTLGRAALRLAAQVRCPSLVLTGDDDRIVEPAISQAVADALGCPLELVAGGGHCVNARHPVWFNLRLRRFVEAVAGLGVAGRFEGTATHART